MVPIQIVVLIALNLSFLRVQAQTYPISINSPAAASDVLLPQVIKEMTSQQWAALEKKKCDIVISLLDATDPAELVEYSEWQLGMSSGASVSYKQLHPNTLKIVIKVYQFSSEEIINLILDVIDEYFPAYGNDIKSNGTDLYRVRFDFNKQRQIDV